MNLPSHLKRAAANTMPALMNQDAHPTTATSTYNAAWPSSPPRRSSPAPDTTSPVYPGRPIRPMPKRRIRDRLSAEHAATIDYPPQPASSSPIFGYPYATAEAEMLASQGGGGHYARPRGLRAGSHEPCVDCGHEHGELSSDEEDEDDGEHRHPAMQFSPDSLQMTRRDGDYYGALPIPTLPGHEGYDSFENMSNKKKRKIPQSGMGGHGHSNSLSADMANISLSQRDGAGDRDGLDEDGTAYAAGNSYGYVHNSPGSAGGGLSGPGRGRFSRSGRGSMDRRPLAPVQNEPGIISAAIANATQSLNTMPTTPTHATAAKGQENISMLQQHAASKSPPQKTDFTFTPEGGVNGPRWPGGQVPPTRAGAERMRAGQGNGVPMHHPSQVGSVQQAAHYPPPPPSNQPHHVPPLATAGAVHPQPPPPANSAQPPAPKPRKPRPLARTFDIAARRRKLQKEYQNFNSPPKRDDIWICEFCEYESIFGVPPRALIWEYEKKDQAERKRLEERRRLLEKAKMKGRKGNRGKKGSKKGAATTQQPATQPAAPKDQGGEYYDDGQTGEQGEYYEDGEYEYDDGVDDPNLPPLTQNAPGAYPPDIPPPPDPYARGDAYPPPTTRQGVYHANEELEDEYTEEVHERSKEQKYARK